MLYEVTFIHDDAEPEVITHVVEGPASGCEGGGFRLPPSVAVWCQSVGRRDGAARFLVNTFRPLVLDRRGVVAVPVRTLIAECEVTS